MAKATATKSSAIAGIIAKKPKATVAEIQAALKEQGVKASNALVNKVKYGRKSKKAGGRRNGASKAEAIRQAWQAMGKDTRPRDIVSSLSDRGIKVSPAQVSMLRHKNGRAAEVVHVVSLEQLVTARKFVEQIGSIATAQNVLSSLARVLG